MRWDTVHLLLDIDQLIDPPRGLVQSRRILNPVLDVKRIAVEPCTHDTSISSYPTLRRMRKDEFDVGKRLAHQLCSHEHSIARIPQSMAPNNRRVMLLAWRNGDVL